MFWVYIKYLSKVYWLISRALFAPIMQQGLFLFFFDKFFALIFIFIQKHQFILQIYWQMLVLIFPSSNLHHYRLLKW